MATEGATDIQKTETSNVATAPSIRTGPVYSPAVDIFENDGSITLLADVAGVKPWDLEIDLRENVLTLTGRVTPTGTSKESNVLREYRPETFFRQFTLSEAIDQAEDRGAADRRCAETRAAEGGEGTTPTDHRAIGQKAFSVWPP
jgi:HSP20 family protein